MLFVSHGVVCNVGRFIGVVDEFGTGRTRQEVDYDRHFWSVCRGAAHGPDSAEEIDRLQDAKSQSIVRYAGRRGRASSQEKFWFEANCHQHLNVVVAVGSMDVADALVLAHRGTRQVNDKYQWSYDPLLKRPSVMMFAPQAVNAFFEYVAACRVAQSLVVRWQRCQNTSADCVDQGRAL